MPHVVMLLATAARRRRRDAAHVETDKKSRQSIQSSAPRRRSWSAS